MHKDLHLTKEQLGVLSTSMGPLGKVAAVSYHRWNECHPGPWVWKYPGDHPILAQADGEKIVLTATMSPPLGMNVGSEPVLVTSGRHGGGPLEQLTERSPLSRVLTDERNTIELRTALVYWTLKKNQYQESHAETLINRTASPWTMKIPQAGRCIDQIMEALGS